MSLLLPQEKKNNMLELQSDISMLVSLGFKITKLPRFHKYPNFGPWLHISQCLCLIFYVVMNTLTKDGIFVRYFKLIVHGSRDVEVVVT